MARGVPQLAKNAWSLARRTYRMAFGYGVWANVNGTRHGRRALLAYIAAPFAGRMPPSHQNVWQAVELARILGDFGYDVDAVECGDRHARPSQKYDLFVDLHPGLNEHLQSTVNSGALRVAYCTGSNPAFSNAAERTRLTALFERRGVRLAPRRQVPPLDPEAFAHCDAMFFIGNEYNLDSYGTVRPPVSFVSNTGYLLPAGSEHDSRRASRFLFLASSGQVHKGLDLLLEAVAARPGLELYVCSAFATERDFVAAYRRELFGTPNIHPVGFVNITSPRFQEIAASCAYVVLPSCSEARAGAVLTGMSAGLIPIVSRECGYDEDEAFFLPRCTVTEVGETLEHYASQSIGWVKEHAARSVGLARDRYAPERYAESVRRAMGGLRRVVRG